MADWTPQEIGLLLGALGATYADTESTKKAIAGGGKESNPLLTRKPSNAELNVAGLLGAAAGLTAATAVPDKYRPAVLGGWLGLESALAYQNKDVSRYYGASDVYKRPVLAGLLGAVLAQAAFGDKSTTISPGTGPGLSVKITKRF
jgi:hypothetical protein